MATLDATLGGADANSYQTRVEAADFFSNHLYATEWSSADNTRKDNSLIRACLRLEQETYKGSKTNTEQRLKHPRAYVEDDEGNWYDQDEIIRAMKEAQCELALYYLKQNPDDAVDPALKQFKRLHIANAINLEMRDQLPATDALPDHVLRMISHLMQSAPGQVRLVRA